MSSAEPYPPGPPGTPSSPSDPLFEGLSYRRAWNAFWLGLAGFCCCGVLAGIPAIYVGARALADIDASQGRLQGKGLAWSGIVLGALGILNTAGVGWYRLHR